jgi:hypothetical protein
MHQAVERAPAAFQVRKQLADFIVARHFARKREVGAELLRQAGDAILEALVLVGERDFRAFAARAFATPWAIGGC